MVIIGNKLINCLLKSLRFILFWCKIKCKKEGLPLHYDKTRHLKKACHEEFSGFR